MEISGVVGLVESRGQGGAIISLMKIKDTNCSAFLIIKPNPPQISTSSHWDTAPECSRKAPLLTLSLLLGFCGCCLRPTHLPLCPQVMETILLCHTNVRYIGHDHGSKFMPNLLLPHFLGLGRENLANSTTNSLLINNKGLHFILNTLYLHYEF